MTEKKNYNALIKAQKDGVRNLDVNQLSEAFFKEMADLDSCAGQLGKFLSRAGQEAIKKSVVDEFNDSLMGGAPDPRWERSREMFLKVIKIGEIIKNLSMEGDAQAIAEQLRKHQRQQ